MPPAPSLEDPQKKKRKVPILVNRESMVQIPTSRQKDGSINSEGILFLTPGYNLVDAEKWALARENPMIQILLNTKIPPAAAPEDNPEKTGHCYLVEGKPMDADNPLTSLSEDEALRFVDETLQVPLLKQLLDQEGRARVLRAIRAQVEKIEAPKREAQARAKQTEGQR